MNNKADFTDHINKVCTKTSQKSGWVLRTFSCRSTSFMKKMWKSLIQGHIDYASQLYQPLQSGNLTRIENLFKTFTKRIPELRELNYWERLGKLRMNSQQRRLERYRILYVWKVLEGLVPNPGILTRDPGTKGRIIKIPSLCTRSSARVRTLREASLNIHGARLFNALPKSIRDIKSCDILQFKEKLDCFLSKIPDQPKIGTLIPDCCDQMTAQPSNSLVDQIRQQTARGRLTGRRLPN